MQKLAFSASLVALAVALVAALGLGRGLAKTRSALAHAEERWDAGLAALAADERAPIHADTRTDEDVAARLARLEQRVARGEAERARSVVVPASAAPQPLPDDDAAAPAGDAPPGDRAARLAELESALAEVLDPSFDWSASSAALERFYELARDSDLLGERIAELEGAVAANPDDLDARMELADFYVARLMTLQGPEQGLWGGRAEAQWRAVIERDADHWESRFRLGNDYAFYPDVMGKTDDAIALLSEARAIQERSTPLPEHVQTYLSLARMHQRKGELEQAREVLRAGLRLHPDDARLAAALSGAGG